MSTPQQDFLKWRFGMFIHFGMATWHDVEWAHGYEDPRTFAPSRLDCGQWARSAKAAGMQYAVLTTKHTGGWCLWPSKHTSSHATTAFSNYREGQGDIVREFVAACREHALKVGLYYCFPRNFGAPKDKTPLHGLPPEAGNQRAGFVKAQLTELLSNYGPIDQLWCDQYNYDLGDDWPEILKLVRSLQPTCIVVANNSLDLSVTDVHSYEYPWLIDPKRAQWLADNNRGVLPPEDNVTPSEVCDILESTWFWHSKAPRHLKSAAQTVDMLTLCNRRHANYLLNVAPDRSGLIPQATVERLTEIGDILRQYDA